MSLIYGRLIICVSEGVERLRNGHLRYGSAHPALIDAIQQDLLIRRNIGASPEEIVITHGAIGALASIFHSLCKPGDEVLLPRPCWPLSDLVESFNLRWRLYPFDEIGDEANLSRSLQAHINARTRVIIINSPNNPSGLYLSSANLHIAISEVANSNILIVLDEVYESLLPRDTGIAFTGHPDPGARIILVSSMSKRFAVPGLRVGFTWAPVALSSAIRRSSGLLTGGVGIVNQEAAAQLLATGAEFEIGLSRIVQNRRDRVEPKLAEAGFDVPRSRLGLFVCPRVESEEAADRICRHALENGLAVVPGSIFGVPSAIRIRPRTT